MSTEIDSTNPLDMDLAAVNTERPLMKPGVIYDFKLVKAEIKTNDAKTLSLEWEALSDVEGKELGTTIPQSRCRLFDNINTEPTGKLLQAKDPWEMIRVRVAQFAQAVNPALTIRDLRERSIDLQGLVATIRIGMRNDGLGSDGIWRPAQNQVAEYIKKKTA